MTICVLGDAHLDVIARVSGPLAPDTDTPASTAVIVGGQAANVAAWVTALGGRSRLIAARGTDMGAHLVAAELQRRGVEVVGPVLAGNAGVVISLSDGGTRRSMLTDRGVGPLLSAAAFSPDWLADCELAAHPGLQPDRGPGPRGGARGRERRRPARGPAEHRPVLDRRDPRVRRG